MSIAARILDGFANVIAGIGAGNAKAAGNGYVVHCDPAQLEAAYRTSTWFGKIVDIPADDAIRQGRSWKAERSQIEAIEAEQRRLVLMPKLRQAIIWARLYGGAVIIPGGLPGDLEEPLDRNRIAAGSVSFLSVLARPEISTEGVIRDPLSPLNGHPEWYIISGQSGRVRVHPSRVVKLAGRRVASTVSQDPVWGDSEWLHLQDAVSSSDAAAAVIGTLMQEAKVDVIKIDGLMANVMTADFEQSMIARFRTAAAMKSVSNALVLDKEDEWEQKQIAWAGLPDVARLLLTIMAGAADIPVTRLLGTSAAGLNATGEGDLRNYYDQVKARQELQLSPAIELLDEVLIRSALGSRPPEVWYDWNPLWQPSDQEEATTAKTEAETDQILVNLGLIPSDALSKAVANRLVERGRHPGLEAALEESARVTSGAASEEEIAAAAAGLNGGEPGVTGAP